ncbi:hypothetical protein BH23VER1_BH23VER1_23950 [soil metagenome]
MAEDANVERAVERSGDAPSLPDEAPSLLERSDIHLSFAEIDDEIAAMSPEEMKALFVGLRRDGKHPQQVLLEHVLSYQLMGRDPEAMLDLKLEYPDLPVLGRTYSLWAQQDSVAALNHLRTLDNETWQRQGLDAILYGMSVAQPDRAFETLLQMPEAGRGHYRKLFGTWGTRVPEEAVSALPLVPERFLGDALVSLADNWAEVDRAAAGAWVEGLPEDQAAIARPAFERRSAQLDNR